jgi:hypothetical protein
VVLEDSVEVTTTAGSTVTLVAVVVTGVRSTKTGAVEFVCVELSEVFDVI